MPGEIEKVAAEGFEGIEDVGGKPPMIDRPESTETGVSDLSPRTPAPAKLEVVAKPEVKKEGLLDSNIPDKDKQAPIVPEKKPVTLDDVLEVMKQQGMTVQQLAEAMKPKVAPEAPKAREPFKPSFRATPELIEKMVSSPEGAVEVLNAMGDALLRDMATITLQHLKETKELEVQERGQQEFAAKEVDRMTNEFLDRHKDLKDYIKEARKVAEDTIDNPPKKFATVQEFYDHIADKTRGMIKEWETRLNAGKSSGNGEKTKATGAPPKPSPKRAMSTSRGSGPDADEMSVIDAVIHARDGV